MTTAEAPTSVATRQRHDLYIALPPIPAPKEVKKTWVESFPGVYIKDVNGGIEGVLTAGRMLPPQTVLSESQINITPGGEWYFIGQDPEKKVYELYSNPDLSHDQQPKIPTITKGWTFTLFSHPYAEAYFNIESTNWEPYRMEAVDLRDTNTLTPFFKQAMGDQNHLSQPEHEWRESFS